MAESVRDGATPSREKTLAHGEPSLSFVNQGARVRVIANSPRVLELVRRVLPVGSQFEGSDSPDVLFSLSVAAGLASDEAPHCLYLDSVLLQRSLDLAPLLRRLESELHFAVATNARSSLFVHAGVVGWQGQGILLPGPSMSGKSSLVAALLRAGADYYSDEYAVVDAQGCIHPYAKPLAPRVSADESRPPVPESIGYRTGTQPLRASLIVSTRFSQGEHFAPATHGRSRGLMILIANTLVIRERPRFALDRLMHVVGGATTLEGLRGDADEAAVWLLRYQDAGRSGSAPRDPPVGGR
jgi:hypothetical protein